MATGRSTQLTKQVGEYLVAAELARRDLLSATFSGNVPHYDIVASGQKGGHIPVQVKAKASGTWQLDIRNFAEVTLSDGKQTIHSTKPEPYPGIVYVFVSVRTYGEDQFFVIDWKDLCRKLTEGYRKYLAKHGGRRPKNPRSFHTAIGARDLADFRDRWETITGRVGPAA